MELFLFSNTKLWQLEKVFSKILGNPAKSLYEQKTDSIFVETAYVDKFAISAEFKPDK